MEMNNSFKVKIIKFSFAAFVLGIVLGAYFLLKAV